jgi:CRISPR-associated protein Cas1
MKTHLNTLFVTTQGAYLARRGLTLLVRNEGKTLGQFPLHTLDGVVCFGRVACSPMCLAACAEKGVTVSFLSLHGRFFASVQGPVAGNVLLRRKQYRAADDPAVALEVSRHIVAAKVANARTVLIRAARDADATDSARRDALLAQALRLAALLVEVPGTADLDRVRGLEGEAASQYFAAFNALQTNPPTPDGFAFTRRTRQPPLDRLNALMSFLYTLLLHDLRSACEAAGLDPCVGYLHTDRPGKPSLALDLMEEFRPFLADRLAFSLINRRQISPEGFQVLDGGSVVMNDATRKTVLVAWQQRKRDTLTHPFLGEPTTVGLLPHLQARLLSRWLRGDLDAYPPFFWKG